jgi:hypothetical protein
MAVDDPSSRRWFLRYKAEATFLVLFAAATVGGAFYIRHAEYVGGMNNLGAEGFIAFIDVYRVLAPISLGFIIWTIIQLLRAFHTGRRARISPNPYYRMPANGAGRGRQVHFE